MKNKREQEAIRAYFAQEPVPVEIHNALRQACQQLPPREKSPAPAAEKAWRRLGGALSTAAAAFVLLCCLNAVNPAFAESVPPVSYTHLVESLDGLGGGFLLL